MASREDDYSLWYYDPTPAEPVNLPGKMGAEGGQLRLEELGPLLEGRPGVFLVAYRDLRTVDPRGQVPFLLEVNGRLTERFSVDRMDVERYELKEGWRFPEPAPTAVSSGPLVLTGVYSQPVVSADDAVAVALRWRLEEPTEQRYRVAVRLWDGDREVARADRPLLNNLGRPTDYWQVGEESLNAYVLPLPLGTPPLTYTLSIRVYDAESGAPLSWPGRGDWLVLSSVHLLRAVGQRSDPYGSWSGTEWLQPAVPDVANGLRLEGYAVRPSGLRPGGTLYVTLRWRAVQDDLAHFMPCLVLVEEEEVLARDCGTLFDQYPTERWAADELLIETRQLTVPPTLAPLELALEVDGGQVPVGEVSVAREALLWTVPPSATPACAWVGDVAELAGYEWKIDVGRPDTLLLVLYWRGMEDVPSDRAYSVFTHLLASDDTLLAQHDGLPSGGERPTTTWLPNEVIADRHELSVDSDSIGPARLLVGMYDLTTMIRLPAYDCAGHRLPNDAVPLAEFMLEGGP